MNSIWEIMFGTIRVTNTDADFEVDIIGFFHATAIVGPDFIVGESPWITLCHPLDNSHTHNFPQSNAELVIGEESE